MKEPALVLIPAGKFLMGSEVGQDNERPVHSVFVDAFLLGNYQVKHAEYAIFLAETQSSPPPFWNDSNFNRNEQPVVAVSWFEAVTYCEWLSAGSGKKYRLPYEAEWEWAARGGVEGKLFPWGDDEPQSLPDYASRWKAGPEPVGRWANAFGIFDICENVHEWCGDWFSPEYYAVSPEQNPRGPESGSRKASRGGSWRHHVKMSRCAARSSIPPEFQYADYGFRVACEVE
ncbi:MAG TPA: SUMF1/EgtB/PvdO family nonheme iron enzyme [Terriglobales bacterium]|nr:SUMF1/EgtB/PvdO family nonheme iron enzyme [Terriglobales bacterium]